MKRTNRNQTVPAGALLFVATVAAARAHSGLPYVLLSATIDAGGGASTSAVYAVTGTVGQPDAGSSAASVYTLESGFWHGLAVVQAPESPVLKIKLSRNFAILSWPLSAPGFVLEETTDLASGQWLPTPGAVVTTATEHTVAVPAIGVVKTFRLRKTVAQP